jgi:hypothetical protein
MNTPKPPPHLVSLADDNRLGGLAVISLLLSGPGILHYFGWGDYLGLPAFIELPMTVLGLILLFFCVRALLRPGCWMILRINHGGLTDFRYSETPLQWQNIHGAGRLPGSLASRLPIILLDMEPSAPPPVNNTLWYRSLHLFLKKRAVPHIVILCGSLDRGTQEILRTIEAHLAQKKTV